MPSSIVQRMIDEEKQPPKYRSKAWRKLVKAIEAEKGRKICGGKRRNNRKPWMNGFPCEAQPIAGRNNCKKHGGHTPAPGPGHHAFKHGRYSKALAGTSFQELYEAARNDPNLLALDDEIALTAARLKEIMSRLIGTDSKVIWETALEKASRVRRLLSTKSTADADKELADLERVFTEGLHDHEVWDEYFNCVEMLRRLVDTERKHRADLGLNISTERAMLMMSLVAHAAQNVLKPADAEKLRAEINLLRTTTDPTYKHDGLILRRDVTNLQALTD